MPNKEEYPQIQAKILKHLFDTASKVAYYELDKVVNKPRNEAQYHYEILMGKGWISVTAVGNNPVVAYEITSAGRKYIMEQ